MPYGPKETPEQIARRREHGKWLGRVVRLVGLTLRYRFFDPWRVRDRVPHPHIYVHWHNRMACAPLWYRRLVPLPQRNTALVSASGDGELLAAAMAEFRIDAARGSKSRGGTEGLLALLRRLREGSDVTVTPDGPRGPRYVLEPGVIALARLSGAPLVPLRFELGWKIELKTWDRFQVPLPFARCTLEIRRPLWVGPEKPEGAVVARLADELGR